MTIEQVGKCDNEKMLIFEQHLIKGKVLDFMGRMDWLIFSNIRILFFNSFNFVFFLHVLFVFFIFVYEMFKVCWCIWGLLYLLW